MMGISICEVEKYQEKIRKKEREEFLDLLLNDEVVRNNPDLQKKYMDIYDQMKKERHYENKPRKHTRNSHEYMWLLW